MGVLVGAPDQPRSAQTHGKEKSAVTTPRARDGWSSPIPNTNRISFVSLCPDVGSALPCGLAHESGFRLRGVRCVRPLSTLVQVCVIGSAVGAASGYGGFVLQVRRFWASTLVPELGLVRGRLPLCRRRCRCRSVRGDGAVPLFPTGARSRARHWTDAEWRRGL